MNDLKQETCEVRIKPEDIPDVDYEIGCSVLASSVRCFFERPGIKEEYEAWLKTRDC